MTIVVEFISKCTKGLIDLPLKALIGVAVEFAVVDGAVFWDMMVSMATLEAKATIDWLETGMIGKTSVEVSGHMFRYIVLSVSFMFVLKADGSSAGSKSCRHSHLLVLHYLNLR
jgi:hypothetical protein